MFKVGGGINAERKFWVTFFGAFGLGVIASCIYYKNQESKYLGLIEGYDNAIKLQTR
jgi:hypothetical protein